MAKQVPYEPTCEVCLERDEGLDKEIRLESLKRGGAQMMALYHPLRPLSMCDRCRGVLVNAVRSWVKMEMEARVNSEAEGLRVLLADET